MAENVHLVKYVVAALEQGCSAAQDQGPPLGSRAGLGDGPSEGPPAAALGVGAGAGGFKGSARDASLQTPDRTMYCSRTLPNALFITFFFYI